MSSLPVYATAALAVGTTTAFTREDIQLLPTRALWAILRSTKAMTERFANELTWAKAELRRRGFGGVQ